MEKDGSNKSLNPKQEMFCTLYASDREFFGNGVESYIGAYNPDRSAKNWYKTACVCASKLLSNVKVCNRINELLEEGGLNDQFVDKQLTFLITQHDDKKAKLGAIKEYNTLKERITKKLQLSNDPERPVGVPDAAMAAEWQEFLKNKTQDG